MIYNSHRESMHMLSGYGLPTVMTNLVRDIDEIQNEISEWGRYRDGKSVLNDYYDFDIDGVVIKVDDKKLRSSIGETSKYPKWAIAYKFPARLTTTIVKGVTFQVGRTGLVTPVAEIKPAIIDGVSISRANLYNADMLKKLNLHIGDTVEVIRSGDVIPNVTRVITRCGTSNTKPITYPDNCPKCRSKLSHDDSIGDGKLIYCHNTKCPGRLEEYIKHATSRDAFNIKGLGDRLVEDLFKEGIIKDLVDVFDLDKSKLLRLSAMGERASYVSIPIVDKILRSIDVAKSINLAKFIFALGIPNIGISTANKIAVLCGDITTFKNNDYPKGTLRPSVVSSLHDYLTGGGITTIDKLIECGISISGKPTVGGGD